MDIFAAFAGRVVGVDDGRVWEATLGDGAVPTCLAVSPTDPDVVCAGTNDDGLFRSTDGGQTWERTDLPYDRVTSVTCARGVDGDDWWAGTEPSAVFHASDGARWTEREGLTDLPSASSWAFPPRPQTHHVRWIEVDPRDPAHLYVAVEAGALVQTHDGGETWEDRVVESRRDTHSMATHRDAPGRVYCAAGDGYAETTDGGETWTHPQEGLGHRYCWSVAVDPDDPDHRLLSSARGAMSAHSARRGETYVYRRHGDTAWEPVEGLPTGPGVARYVLAVSDDFYALSNTGLFVSRDGVEWERLPVDVPEDATAQGLVVTEG